MTAQLSASLLLSTSLSGCAVIDEHVRVPGWPDLKVVEHHVSHEEMREHCVRYTVIHPPEGCTVFLFDRQEAHIYVSKDFPAGWVLEHERPHAAGYDHIGSTNMQRLWQDWRARHRPSSGSAF